MTKKDNLIIFDYDGTLADTFDMNLKIINGFADRINLKQLTKKEFVEMNAKNPFDGFKDFGLTKKDIELFLILFQRESLKSTNLPKLFPNLKPVIKKISNDSELIVVTSNLTKVAQKFLKYHKIDQYFSDVLGADKEKSKVKKIKKLIQTHKSQNIIYIGDTIGDILETKRAKCQIISVSWGYFPLRMLKSAKPDFIVKKPQDLITIIDKHIKNS